ncbi:MAG: DUF177 domain-containing protein [Candidatus Omnitrophica bacterium]|nr:DUF177 domain-containing protein [Candidatus Omnitrophota bacterium]
MRININQIPAEGLEIEESLQEKELDLETTEVRFRTPVRVKAFVSRITNAVSAQVTLDAGMILVCGRCLEQFDYDFHKDFKLNYQAEKQDQFIDFNPDIREEIILDYPIKPLCKNGCLGLCPKCGKNLNEGGCTCGTT